MYIQLHFSRIFFGMVHILCYPSAIYLKTLRNGHTRLGAIAFGLRVSTDQRHYERTRPPTLRLLHASQAIVTFCRLGLGGSIIERKTERKTERMAAGCWRDAV